MATKPSNFEAKLKKLDGEVRLYLEGLKGENLTLHRTIAKLRVQDLSNQNRIKALEDEMKENRPEVHVNISQVRGEMTPEQMKAELMTKLPSLIIPMMEEAGYTVIPPTG